MKLSKQWNVFFIYNFTQGMDMFLTNNVMSILTEKLGFEQSDLFKVESDLELSAKCIGYLHLVQSKSVGKGQKMEALEKLHILRERLRPENSKLCRDLENAWKTHYSFRNA